jgi:hypothetical protein
METQHWTEPFKLFAEDSQSLMLGRQKCQTQIV